MIAELNSFLTGWVTYFRYAACKTSPATSWTSGSDASCAVCGSSNGSEPRPIADFLRSLGVPEEPSWMLALSGKGWWRMAAAPRPTKR